jgi:general secretion pathway protein F
MAAIRYQALDATGRTVSGVLQAETARQGRARLRAQGLLPLSVEIVEGATTRGNSWRRGISAAALCMITRQMATLLDAGLTLEQTLSALIEAAESVSVREVLHGVQSGVKAGHTLAAAMGCHGESFPVFFCALVRGGEESGSLPIILRQLADYLEQQENLKQKTALALLYPLVVGVVALCIVAGLLAYVVPQVVQVFQQSRQNLPLLTRALIALSDFLRLGWPYLGVTCVALWLAAVAALKRDTMQRRCHALLLRMPLAGSLLRGINTTRFASTLAILTGGGVPLLGALEAAARATTNRIMRDAVETAATNVREGSSLARALSLTGAFPPMLAHLVASGEASGRLQEMLERAARLENEALERRLRVLVTLVEPLMILMMGGMVLLIVLAILLPIIDINQLVR